MRFFVNIDDITYECHSVGDYIGTLIGTCLGKILAWLTIFGLIALAIWYFFS